MTAAVVAALLAFTAVPAVLALVVGNPLSGGLGHAWQTLPRDTLCVLTVAAWMAWAACCAQLVRAVVTHVRSGDIGARGDGSVLDRIAARISIGVLALTSIGTPLALTSDAGASAPVPSAHVRIGLPAAQTSRSSEPTAARTTHTVQPGETLWRIADERLGDGADWTAIAALNLGRAMATDTRFVDPDQIRAGWRLRLPLTAAATHEPPSSAHRADDGTVRSGEHLPELVALGLGSLACAALARRARRRHRTPPFSGELPLVRPPSDDAIDAAALLERFAGVPALQSFEAANCLLGRMLQDAAAGPRVRAICVSEAGVTFWLTEPRDDAPTGFVPVRDGSAWHVDHGALGDQDAFTPYVPLALPVGDDAEGTWLVALGPGDVLPLLGEAAPSLVRSMQAAAGAWAWSDMIVATDDPHDPGLARPVATDPRMTSHHLFFGDPGSLPAEVARHSAVVTTATVAASNLTVLVDRQGATLHPMGRVVRPHLQSVDMAGALGELMAPPEREVEPRHADRDEVPWPDAVGGTAALCRAPSMCAS